MTNVHIIKSWTYAGLEKEVLGNDFRIEKDPSQRERYEGSTFHILLTDEELINLEELLHWYNQNNTAKETEIKIASKLRIKPL